MQSLIFWLICAMVVGSLGWVLWIVIRWIRSDADPERFRPTPPPGPPGE